MFVLSSKIESMKRFILILVFSKLTLAASTQSEQKIPRLVKTPISNTGCSAYFPKVDQELTFELSYSQDSSKMYTGEVEHGTHKFAIIMVKMNHKLSETKEKEELLTNYLDYLKTSFEIAKSAGYGKGHTMESEPKATGVIDYWEGKDKTQWGVKAWAAEDVLAIMMLYGPEKYPIFNVQKMFLDGFRFK